GLLIIGAPMAISLSLLAALLTFVPYVGAVVSAVPAVLLAFTKGSDTAFYVILVYLIAHVVEGYIVVPLIQHRMVYLPPAMILATQFLGTLLRNPGSNTCDSLDGRDHGPHQESVLQPGLDRRHFRGGVKQQRGFAKSGRARLIVRWTGSRLRRFHAWSGGFSCSAVGDVCKPPLR